MPNNNKQQLLLTFCGNADGITNTPNQSHDAALAKPQAKTP